MALTTAELITRCQNRFVDTGNTIVAASGTSGNSWEQYLTQAYQWVCSASGPAQWPFTYATATLVYPTQTATQPLPAGCGTLNVVFNLTDGYVLEPFPTRIERFIQFPNSLGVNGSFDVGSPSYYRVAGDNLELTPLPQVQTSIYLEYEKDMADLSVTGPVDPDPGFPRRHADLLVEYALYLAYTDDDDVETAQSHLQRAEVKLKYMQADLMSNRNTRNYEIVDEFF